MSESERELRRRELWERYEVAKRKKAMLLGERFYTPLKEEHYQNSITLEKLPLLKELLVRQKPTFPVALFLQLASFATNTLVAYLYKVQFREPLQIGEREIRILHTVTHKLYNPLMGDSEQFEIYSSNENKSVWTLHCTGFAVASIVDFYGQYQFNIDEIKKTYPTPLDINLVYDQMMKDGIVVGENLRSITEMWKNDDGLFAHIRFPNSAQSNEFTYSTPAILETCFHAMLALYVRQGLHTPAITSIESFVFHQWFNGDVWCRTHSDYSNSTSMIHVNMWIYNDEGKEIVSIYGIRVEYLD